MDTINESGCLPASLTEVCLFVSLNCSRRRKLTLVIIVYFIRTK